MRSKTQAVNIRVLERAASLGENLELGNGKETRQGRLHNEILYSSTYNTSMMTLKEIR